MIKMNIKPIAISGLNCFATPLLEVAAYYKRDYQLCFGETIIFEYDNMNKKKLLGERLKQGWKNQDTLFVKYCNINLDIHRDFPTEKVIMEINDQLAIETPIGITVDSFWCPWNPNFQKSHFLHNCLIIGTDYENNYYVLDAEYGNIVYTLPQEYYKDVFRGCFCFTKNQKERKNYKQTMLELFAIIIESKSITMLSCFIDDFKSSLDFKREFEIGDQYYWGNLLFRNLYYSYSNMLQFNMFLQFMFNKNKMNGLLSIIEDVENVGNKYKKTCDLLWKAYYEDDPSITINKVCSIFDEILNLTKIIFSNITFIYDSENHNVNHHRE